MGLTQKLIEMFGVPALIKTLEEKDPALLTFIDKLDEETFPKALGAYLKEREKLPKSEIDWNTHVVSFLTVKPAILAIGSILEDLGITEISGIEIMPLIKELADYEEG